MTPLHQPAAYPVCTASYLGKVSDLEQPSQLLSHQLICHISNSDEYGIGHERDWQQWLMAKKLPVDQVKLRPFQTVDKALQTVMAGEGIALGGSCFVDDHVTSGELVKVFQSDQQGASMLSMACPQETREKSKIVALRDWVLEGR